MKKRLLSIFLCIAMIIGLLPAGVFAAEQNDSAHPFRDVSVSSWYRDAVQYVYEHGIFNGTSNDRFSPEETMTRGMFVTVLGRMAGVDTENYQGQSPFTDVSADEYYAPYVAWAAKHGVTLGTGGGNFSPDEKVTRQQMATFFIRYFETFNVAYDTGANITTTPEDLNLVADYAKDAVLKLWKTGLLEGDNVNFDPEGMSLRAQAATLCMRVDQTVEVWYKEPGVPSDDRKPDQPEKPDGGSSTQYYEVKFAAGSGQNTAGLDLPETNLYPAGTNIFELPTPYQRGYVFLGWYYDETLTSRAETTDTLSKNLTLYAKMSALGKTPFQETPSYCTKTDVGTDFTFRIKVAGMSLAEVKEALTVTQITANNVDLDVTVADMGGGIFEVTYPYTEGQTYRARLEEDSGAVFVVDDVEQPASTLDLNFITAKAEVLNLTLNDGLVYMPKAEVSGMSDSLSGLFTVTVGGGEVEQSPQKSGTFTYSGSEMIAVGDTVAIYEGVEPNKRTLQTDNDGTIVYVNITGKNNETYSYRTADPTDVLFTPDVLPVPADEDTDHVENQITVPKTVMDYSGDQYAAMGLDSQTTVDAGDYLAFYSGDISTQTGTLEGYAEITGVTEEADGYIITYSGVTQDQVLSSMDIYSTRNEDIELTPEQKASIEDEIAQQAIDSGFVEQASNYLVTMALETEDFTQLPENITVQDYSVASVRMAAKASKPEVETKVRAYIRDELQHFSDLQGLRVELKLECEISFRKEGNDNVFKITLEAQFEQEVILDINVSGGAIWKWAWIFPYIYDYQLNANIDIGTFTGISATITMATEEDEEEDDDDKDDDKDEDKDKKNFLGIDWGKVVDFDQSLDDYAENLGGVIDDYIEERDAFYGEEADDVGPDSELSALMEQYAEMIEEADDSWIDLVKKEIFNVEGSVDPFHILVFGISADFVVKANVYITLGMTFEYGNAKRYNYSLMLFHKRSTSETIDLETENYEFTFYVMGTLGFRVGVEFEIAVGLFSLKLDKIGITAEAGAYAQLWGYFYYKLNWVKGEEKTEITAGALHIEIGLYLEIKFIAQLFSSDELSYNPTLYEQQWPLYTIGERENIYAFNWTPEDGEEAEGPKYSFQTVRTFTLPTELFDMAYMDLQTGELCGKDAEDEDENPAVNYDDRTESRFTIELSNPAFSYDPATNTVTVTPGEDSIAESCEMTLIWNGGTLAFTSKPIRLVVMLEWTDPLSARFIAFDSQGGSAVKMLSQSPGTAITPPAEPTKTGYTFAGWYTDMGCTEKYTIPAEMPEFDPADGVKGVTVYAKWTPKTDTRYTVRYYYQALNGSYYEMGTKAETGTTDTAVAPNTNAPMGFTYNSNKSTVYQAIAPNGSTVVKVYFSRNKYNLTFSYGVDGLEPIVYKDTKYGASITAPKLNLGGYTFDGWDTAVAESMPAGNMTYTATWSPASGTPFRVEYYVQDAADGTKFYYQQSQTGNGTTNDNVDLTAYQTYGEVGQFTLDHATVDGTDANIDNLKVKGDGSLVVKLYFARNTYTATWDVDGVINTEDYRFGQIIVKPENPTKPGYTFAGWEGYTDGMTMAIADVTFTAKWTANTDTAYTVEHWQQNVNDDDYTLVAADTQTLQGTTGELTEAAANSYEGFTKKAFEQAAIAGDGSTVVKMFYDRNVHTVTWKSEGAIVRVDPLRYGAELTAPELSKYGYGLSWSPQPVSTMPNVDLIYTAIWTAGQYTISFQPGGGNEVESITQAYGTAVTKPTDPTRTGYSFGGWYENSDCSGSPYTFTTMPAGGLTLYAKWDAVTYTITYELNGGRTDNPNGYTVEQLPLALSAPTKTGYTFVGWTGSNGDTPETNVTLAKGDTGGKVFTAHWIAKKNTAYTVQHYQQNLEDDTYTLVDTEDKAGTTGGQTVAAAKSYEGFTAQPFEQGVIAADGTTVVKIMYDRNVHTVIWKDGTAVAKSESLRYGAVLTPPSLEKEGYGLSWAPTPAATMPDRDLSYTAVWTAGQYTISFQSNGGSTLDRITAAFGTPVTAPTAPSRLGYTFGGWYEKSDCSGSPYIFTTMPANSLTLYAKWNIVSYNITYVMNGGSASNPATYTVEQLPLVLNTPTKEGYTFSGWSDANGERVTGIDPGNAGDQTFTANWTANTDTVYTVKHYQQNLEDDEYTLVESDTQTLYGTTGEQTSAEAKNYEGFTANAFEQAEIAPDGSTVLEIRYDRNLYMLTWELSGGIADNEYTQGQVRYGTPIVVPDAKKTGYGLGWREPPAATMPAKNVTYTAVWTAGEYSITFQTNGGSAVDSITAAYGTLVTAPADPTRLGYTFGGWYVDSECTGDTYTFTTMPADGLTLYAKWVVEAYAITYELNGGTNSGMNPDTYTVEDTVVLAAPEKEGYTFVGWKDADGRIVAQISKGSTGDQTLSAEWRVNTYTIQFQPNNGGTIEDISGKYGTAITWPENPTKTGYTFGGWYTDPSYGTAYSGGMATMPAFSGTLYAKWTLDTYTITYNGVDSVDSSWRTEYTVNTDSFQLPQPTKTGYTFTGWTGSNGETASMEVTVSLGTTGNLTYTANWTPITYTVQFEGGTGTNGSTGSLTCTYDQSQSLPASGFTMVGYTFSGWNTKPDGTGTSYSAGASVKNLAQTNGAVVTLYAQWEQNMCTVTFKNYNGTVLKTESVAQYSGTATPPEAPTRTGHTFAGWDRDALENFAEDTVITATYTANQYSYTISTDFDFRVGTESYGTASIDGVASGGKLTYGESYTITATPATGYSYDGFTVNGARYTGYTFTAGLENNVTVHFKREEFQAYTNWYRVFFGEWVGSTNNNSSVDVKIIWSDGSISATNLNTTSSFQSFNAENYGVYPTQVQCIGKGWNLDRRFYYQVIVYDLNIDSNSNYVWIAKGDDYISVSKPNYQWNISVFCDESKNQVKPIPAITVSPTGTAKLNLTTYGISGALSGLTYTTNSSAVTASGNTLTIDGSKLTTSDTTVTVYANGTAVTSFVCRQAD